MPHQCVEGCMAHTLRFRQNITYLWIVKGFVILTLEGFFLVSAVYGPDFSTFSLTRVVGASPGRICMYVRAFFLFSFFSDVGVLIFWVVFSWRRRSSGLCVVSVAMTVSQTAASSSQWVWKRGTFLGSCGFSLWVWVCMCSLLLLSTPFYHWA